MDRETILKRLDLKLQDANPHTRAQYQAHARRFLGFAAERVFEEGEREWLVREYREKLRAEGRAPSYVDFIIQKPVKRVFQILGMRSDDWPLRGQSRLGRPRRRAFRYEAVVEMIRRAKELTDQALHGAVAYFALATQFALRREELCRIRQQDINYDRGLVFIRTAKEGEERWHLLPGELRPYLERYKFRRAGPNVARVVELSTMSNMFNRLLTACGVDKEKGLSYHGIRHTLITLFPMWDISLADTSYYLRWSLAGMEDRVAPMLDVYTVPGEVLEDVMDIDRRVLAKHPFVKEWALRLM